MWVSIAAGAHGGGVASCLAGQGASCGERRRYKASGAVDPPRWFVRESLGNPRTIVLSRVTSSIVVCKARPFATWVGVGIVWNYDVRNKFWLRQFKIMIFLQFAGNTKYCE